MRVIFQIAAERVNHFHVEGVAGAGVHDFNRPDRRFVF